MNELPFLARIEKRSSQNNLPDLVAKKSIVLPLFVWGALKIHQTSHGLGCSVIRQLSKDCGTGKGKGGVIDPGNRKTGLFGRLALFLLVTQFHQKARTFRALEMCRSLSSANVTPRIVDQVLQSGWSWTSLALRVGESG